MKKILQYFILVLLLTINEKSLAMSFDAEHISDVLVGQLWRGEDISAEKVRDYLIAISHDTSKDRVDPKIESEIYIQEWKDMMFRNAETEQKKRSVKSFLSIVENYKEEFGSQVIIYSLNVILDKYS